MTAFIRKVWSRFLRLAYDLIYRTLISVSYVGLLVSLCFSMYHLWFSFDIIRVIGNVIVCAVCLVVNRAVPERG